MNTYRTIELTNGEMWACNREGEGVFVQRRDGTWQQFTGTGQAGPFRTPAAFSAYVHKNYRNDHGDPLPPMVRGSSRGWDAADSKALASQRAGTRRAKRTHLLGVPLKRRAAPKAAVAKTQREAAARERTSRSAPSDTDALWLLALSDTDALWLLALRQEAGQAGDAKQVDLCDRALAGGKKAMAKCCAARAEARGAGSSRRRGAKPIRFRDLNVGQTFDFVGPNPSHNSFTYTCTKDGPRTYSYAAYVGGGHPPQPARARVGSINVEVYHVDGATSVGR